MTSLYYYKGPWSTSHLRRNLFGHHTTLKLLTCSNTTQRVFKDETQTNSIRLLESKQRHICNLPPDSKSYPQHVKALPNNLGHPFVTNLVIKLLSVSWAIPLTPLFFPQPGYIPPFSTSTTTQSQHISPKSKAKINFYNPTPTSTKGTTSHPT